MTRKARALSPTLLSMAARISSCCQGPKPPGPITIVGHTDSRGDDAYNLRLSRARAQAVADWFGGQVGIRTRAFQVSGRGETAPIAANVRPDGSDDPESRARNRRVEVVIPGAR